VDADVGVAHVVSDDDDDVRGATLSLNYGAVESLECEHDGDRGERP
jgi:hypothetical protein